VKKELLRSSVILSIMGRILLILGLAMAISTLCSFIYGEEVLEQLLWSTLITITTGLIFAYSNHKTEELSYKEGFAIVGLGWIVASLFGSLPFALSGYFPSYISALFETVSGITTTGATVLADVEVLPRGLLFWRSLTQWLGGMGIMVLFIALIQVIGVRANQIYRAEIPGGAVAGKVTPKARDTAKNFWKAYIGLSLVLLLLLWAEGMSLFHAFCHTFTTMATGGFSTWNDSIAHYGSPAIEWTIIIFMFLAGTNFSLHYLALIKKDLGIYLHNREWKFYVLILLISSIVVFIDLSHLPLGEYRIRDTLFQVISMMTSTGFTTDNYLQWNLAAQGILIIMLFVGACVGSTSGGIKAGRLLIMLQRVRIEFKKIIHPRAIISQRLDQSAISEHVIINVLLYFFLYIVMVLIGMSVLAGLNLDLITSFSAAAACMGNVGPAFGSVGPLFNYGIIPDAGKLVLSFLMLLGRLEIFPLLVLFYPQFWKK
jgi:trk system potassium uptake protein TrkH